MAQYQTGTANVDPYGTNASYAKVVLEGDGKSSVLLHVEMSTRNVKRGKAGSSLPQYP